MRPGGGSFEQPPSTVDEVSSYRYKSGEGSNDEQPDTRRSAAGFASMSGKQEGVSNSTTDNPFMYEPGKSAKREGEPETPKLKGTVDPRRPQA